MTRNRRTAAVGVGSDLVSQGPDPVGEGLPARVIAIGASAGGIDALQRLDCPPVARPPGRRLRDLHIPATGRSLLAKILDRDGPLRAVADERHAAAPGTSTSPRPTATCWCGAAGSAVRAEGERRPPGDRPAVPLAGRVVGRRGIAVVLSGALDDGAGGAVAVAAAGGTVVVQDPGDALVPGMPANTIAAVPGARPARASGARCSRVVAQPAPEEAEIVPDVHGFHPDLTRGRPDGPPSASPAPSAAAPCGSCGRVTSCATAAASVTPTPRRRSSTPRRAAVEAALWAALEVLEERGELLRRIADRMCGRTR